MSADPAPVEAFAHVRTWVFDLDNTLYPPEARLFDQISARMTDWVMHNLQMSRGSADLLRRSYWARFGTTLSGLMAEHGVEPTTFLAHVHKIDLSGLQPDPALAAAIRALPGRKIVHTNADEPYALKVLHARGLDGVFERIWGIEHTGYRPKPAAEAYAQVIAGSRFAPAGAAMFDDEARNLAVPHGLGMATVHVAPERDGGAHVQHWTGDLTDFLTAMGKSA